MGPPVLLLLFAVCLLNVNGARLPVEVCTVNDSPGDVYLGGMFSLHDNGDGLVEGCGRRLPVSALQEAEAMVFAIKTINDDDTILPNVTLGFMIHDYCSRYEYAMWGSLSLIMGARALHKGDGCRIPGLTTANTDKLVVGMVGPGDTASSEAAASTASLFQRPLVSYGATSLELLEEGGFPYYFSTIPSDGAKSQAIVDILEHFGWQYVALVSADEYNTLYLTGEIWNEAEDRRICMHVAASVSEIPTANELQEMVKLLQEHPHAMVVVLVAASAVTANAVFSAVQASEKPLNITWVVSDFLVGDATLRNGLAQGGIFVEYRTPELVEFEHYFRSLTDASSETIGNPWLDKFCGNSERCQVSSRKGFSKSVPTLAPTIDAVFALAHALDETIRELNCSGRPMLSECLGELGAEDIFLNKMRSVSFRGTRGDFRFDQKTVPGEFVVRNMQRGDDGVFRMVEIGSWSSGPGDGKKTRLQIDESLIQWHIGIGDKTPRSVCRDECLPGYIEAAADARCCWVCRACNADEITNGSMCVKCKEDEWPNTYRTACEKLVPQFVEWGDPLVVMLVLLTSLGLLLCGLTAFGMIRHRNHLLIKASSRELSCVNILGLVLAYLAVFPLLRPPGPVVCGAAQSLYALSFTLIYAPLLLKVNRIHRIFQSSTKSAKAPRYTGPVAQLLILAVLVIVQALVILVTALAVPLTWTSTLNLFPAQPDDLPRVLEIFCELDVGFLAAMCYNACLVLACCLYAFKARNVPGNYNEARFYVASVYTTAVLILAALPVYFTAEAASTLAVSLGLVLIMNGYVTLLCVYIPKLYAINFKNVEERDDKAKGQSEGFKFRSRPAFSHGNVSKVCPSLTSKE